MPNPPISPAVLPKPAALQFVHRASPGAQRVAEAIDRLQALNAAHDLTYPHIFAAIKPLEEDRPSCAALGALVLSELTGMSWGQTTLLGMEPDQLRETLGSKQEKWYGVARALRAICPATPRAKIEPRPAPRPPAAAAAAPQAPTPLSALSPPSALSPSPAVGLPPPPRPPRAAPSPALTAAGAAALRRFSAISATQGK
jgi:hypothetical protein